MNEINIIEFRHTCAILVYFLVNTHNSMNANEINTVGFAYSTVSFSVMSRRCGIIF